MKDIPELLVLVIGALLGGIAALVFVPLLLCLFFLYWLIGTRITLTESGKKIGHVRWFKFYRTQ